MGRPEAYIFIAGEQEFEGEKKNNEKNASSDYNCVHTHTLTFHPTNIPLLFVWQAKDNSNANTFYSRLCG